MMKIWSLFLIFSHGVLGETSNLVCTSSMDIKNCIYKNQEIGFKICTKEIQANEFNKFASDLVENISVYYF